jgi:hypothetical protein
MITREIIAPMDIFIQESRSSEGAGLFSDGVKEDEAENEDGEVNKEVTKDEVLGLIGEIDVVAVNSPPEQ